MQSLDPIQNARMQDLADAGNVVYTYRFASPEKSTDASHALTFARDAFSLRRSLGENVPDTEARTFIANKDPTLALFSRTHPHTFFMVTEWAGGARHLQVLQELGCVRKQVEDGRSEEQANVHVSSLLMDQCKRDVTRETTSG
jgi:hypothetical protein